MSPQRHKWMSGRVKTRTHITRLRGQGSSQHATKWPWGESSVRGGGSGISKGWWREPTCPQGHGAVMRPTCGRWTLTAARGGRFGKPESSCHHTLFCGVFMDYLCCSPQQTVSPLKPSACHIFLKAKVDTILSQVSSFHLTMGQYWLSCGILENVPSHPSWFGALPCPHPSGKSLEHSCSRGLGLGPAKGGGRGFRVKRNVCSSSQPLT